MIRESDSQQLYDALFIKSVHEDMKAAVFVTQNGGKLRDCLPAVMVGCEYDKVAHIGESGRFLQEPEQHPILKTKLLELGSLGDKSDICDYPIGNCAENDAANQVLNDHIEVSNLQQLRFTQALCPRTFQQKDTCNNCNFVFGTNSLDNVQPED